MTILYLLGTTWNASARRPAGRPAAAVFGSIRCRISVASPVAVARLAAVGTKGLDLLIEGVGDVNMVVGRCPVQHPDLLHRPRLQRLVVEQCAVGGVACVGVGGGQCDFAGRPVVDMAARAKPGPVPFRAPRQQLSGAHLADHPHDLAAELDALDDCALSEPRNLTSRTPRMRPAACCSQRRIRGIAPPPTTRRCLGR